MSSEFGRLMISGSGSSRIQSTSLSNSLRSTPRSPCSIEMVRSPSMRASVEIARLANAPITRGESHSRSSRRGCPTKKRHVLLQVHADPAKQHAIATDVRLVRPRRRVYRHQSDVVATRQQLARQCVIAGAAAAVHPRRAGRDLEDPHFKSQVTSHKSQVTDHKTFIATRDIDVSDQQRRCLKCAGPEQKLHDVAFVRLQPVELRGRNRAEIQPVDVHGVEQLAAKCLVASDCRARPASGRSPRASSLADTRRP